MLRFCEYCLKADCALTVFTEKNAERLYCFIVMPRKVLGVQTPFWKVQLDCSKIQWNYCSDIIVQIVLLLSLSYETVLCTRTCHQLILLQKKIDLRSLIVVIVNIIGVLIGLKIHYSYNNHSLITAISNTKYWGTNPFSLLQIALMWKS